MWPIEECELKLHEEMLEYHLEAATFSVFVFEEFWSGIDDPKIKNNYWDTDWKSVSY